MHVSTDGAVDYNTFGGDVRVNDASGRVEEGEAFTELQDTLLNL